MKIIYLFIFVILIILITKYSESLESFFMPKASDAYKTAYDLGKHYLELVDTSKLKYPAVMFDIDGTLIDDAGKKIKPIINLLNECIKKGLIIVIITARLNDYHDATVKQLKRNNINYEFILLRKRNDNVNTFKSEIKQELVEKHNIVTIMSVGDNIIDINGNYSGYWIKLPNEYDSNLYHLNSNNKFEIVKY